MLAAHVREVRMYHAGGTCCIHDLFDGAEFPEYVMHFLPKLFWDPKNGNMLGNFSQLLLPSKKENYLKFIGTST